MAVWITDRTQADVDRVKQLAEKAKSGTWTEEEQAEWASGMKGALSYTDYNRIENGMKEIADIIRAAHEPKQGLRVVRVETAEDSDGNIPAWTDGSSTTYFFAPMIFKKDGLALKSLEFQIKGYLSGDGIVIFRKYSPLEDDQSIPTDALIQKTIKLKPDLNDVLVSMDDFPLEEGVEYQFYIYSANKFYSPFVQPSQISENQYVDIIVGSEYCDGDSSRLFSGTVTFSETFPTDWDINGYLTVSDAARWLRNVAAIRAKCSGYSNTPVTPENLTYSFKVINQVEKVLADIEKLAKDHLYYCSEPICGGEPYYAVY